MRARPYASCLRLRTRCGRASLTPRDVHHLCSGHIGHCGARGVHMVAPSSIIAWLKSPGRSGSSSDFCALPRRFPSLGGSKHAVEYALYVAIHDGDGFSEGDARDRRRGVAPDAGKFAPCSAVRGKFPLRSRTISLGRLMHAAGAMVVAKAAPQREHRLSRGRSARICTLGNRLQPSARSGR